jgi:hypothetical protein
VLQSHIAYVELISLTLIGKRPVEALFVH